MKRKPVYQVKFELWGEKVLAHARRIDGPDESWTQVATFNAVRWIRQGKAVEEVR